MSVNTPANWSAHALRMRLGMPSWPAALREITHLKVLLMSDAVKERPQVLLAGHVSGTVLSSKRAKKLFSSVTLAFLGKGTMVALLKLEQQTGIVID